MRTHHLKTWPEPFGAVLRGDKRYEIRDAPKREPGDGYCPCGERLDKPHHHGEY